MATSEQFVEVPQLGVPQFASPLNRSVEPHAEIAAFVPDTAYVCSSSEVPVTGPQWFFQKAGPRRTIYFDPSRTRAAIVTCGGLCPGLNDVIRSVYLELSMNYGVRDVLGIRYGYQGLNPQSGEPPVQLTNELVEDIHREAGTILGSSRGEQPAPVMVDFLEAEQINILFCVGGDGTQRGAHSIQEEVRRRGLDIAVVGIPKTIDNDIMFCEQSFGLVTAVAVSQQVLDCAHAESKGVPYGVGLVKLMGREAGFIAAAATLASQDVNFTLVPELPFKLEGERGFLPVLLDRMRKRRHAVVVVAEGAGQHLMRAHKIEHDASGNVKFQDIGPFLKQKILSYCEANGLKIDVKYIDPSYVIRSVPANCEDSMLCDQFARSAVHAAMAGKTDVLIGRVNARFVHVPISMISGKKKCMSLDGELWASVLAATGQPKNFS
jgi:6-phosphofructokinase 1